MALGKGFIQVPTNMYRINKLASVGLDERKMCWHHTGCNYDNLKRTNALRFPVWKINNCGSISDGGSKAVGLTSHSGRFDAFVTTESLRWILSMSDI